MLRDNTRAVDHCISIDTKRRIIMESSPEGGVFPLERASFDRCVADGFWCIGIAAARKLIPKSTDAKFTDANSTDANSTDATDATDAKGDWPFWSGYKASDATDAADRARYRARYANSKSIIDERRAEMEESKSTPAELDELRAELEALMLARESARGGR